MTGLEDDAAARLAIPADALERARTRRREGATLAEALADLGAADPGAFTRALADAAALPFAVAAPALPARDLLDVLPMPYARRHLVLPLARGPAGLEVAIADPGALWSDTVTYGAGTSTRFAAASSSPLAGRSTHVRSAPTPRSMIPPSVQCTICTGMASTTSFASTAPWKRSGRFWTWRTRPPSFSF